MKIVINLLFLSLLIFSRAEAGLLPSPDQSGQRLSQELLLLENEEINLGLPTLKAQNIASKKGEIQDQSSTTHKKKGSQEEKKSFLDKMDDGVIRNPYLRLREPSRKKGS
jgi:hypothetical protein